MKDALLARFPHVRAAFNQAAFIESLNLPHQVLADIWLPVGFPPVSFEPLNEEEEKVAQTGQFTNSNVRSRNNPNNPNYSTGSPNSVNQEFRSGNRGRGAMDSSSGPGGRQQSNRQNSRTGYVPANPRYSDRSQQHQHQHQHQHSSYDDDVIEDPDNLWATPSADAVGSSDFGSFDANGMFRTGGASSILDGGLEDFASSAAAFEGFMQTRPHHAATEKPPVPAAAPVVISAPVSPTVAIPHITPDTQWVYRDPSGQIQGPFPSHRMLEWYNGKYFPENLPLRRDQDAFFEPLSTWKTKCAGQIPFAAYSKAPEPPKPVAPVAPVVSEQRRTEPVSVSQWFTEPVKAEPVVTKSTVSEATPSSSPSVNVPVATPQTRSVPLESLFGNVSTKTEPVASAIEKPASPEVMMPGWKKLEKPSISAKFGQMNLSESVPAAEPASAPAVKPAPVPEFTEIPKPALATSASWSSASSNSALKKISLSEIMKSSEEPNIILETPQPAPVPAIPVSSASAGWAKISASPVQSLSTIQAEEASARQRSASTSTGSSSSNASKSFADLVRSAGVITSGDIVVSPTVTDRTPLALKPTVVPATPAKPVAPATAAPVSVAKTTSASVPAASVSIEDWCLSSLKQSSLSKSIDPQTCTFLLLDLPNPAALFTFSLETLKPLESGNGPFDLAAFVQELSTKKFGAKATEKVQWSKLKSSPQVKKQEESFEVVKRKK